MQKKNHVWAIIGLVIIIGGIVLYRQWQLDGFRTELRDASAQIFDSGADLPALTDPDFTTITDADIYLSDEVDGVALEINGQSYFFSYQILNWHEVVNITGETNIAVTHCTLCRSSAVYTSNDLFAHAGKIWNNNELLIDASTGSYWNQITGTAIEGSRSGEQLTTYPFDVMSWGEWKDLHSSGYVLSNETGYDRDYSRHPFENYDIADIVYFPMNNVDSRVSAKWIIDGVEIGDTRLAFVRKIMQGTWVLNFKVEDQRYVAFYDTELEETNVFSAADRIFTYDQENNLFVDQDGNAWTAQGEATRSEETLEEQRTNSMFHMCWYANHTDTLVAFIDLMNDDGVTETEDVEAAE